MLRITYGALKVYISIRTQESNRWHTHKMSNLNNLIMGIFTEMGQDDGNTRDSAVPGSWRHWSTVTTTMYRKYGLNDGEKERAKYGHS